VINADRVSDSKGNYYQKYNETFGNFLEEEVITIIGTISISSGPGLSEKKVKIYKTLNGKD